MISINGKILNKDIKELDLYNNKLIHLPVELWQLTQLLCIRGATSFMYDLVPEQLGV